MSFDNAFKKTVGLERGFSMDPDDNGNWTGGKKGIGELKGTNDGISAAAYPNEDIANLTLERKKFLYKRDYWDSLNLDKVSNENIQEEIFDTGVNMGIGRAARIVQESINFLEIGNPLTVDGDIGPVTLSYLNKWCKKDPEALFKVLNGFQFIRYVEIVRSPQQEKFAYGWTKRVQTYKS